MSSSHLDIEILLVLQQKMNTDNINHHNNKDISLDDKMPVFQYRSIRNIIENGTKDDKYNLLEYLKTNKT